MISVQRGLSLILCVHYLFFGTSKIFIGQVHYWHLNFTCPWASIIVSTPLHKHWHFWWADDSEDLKIPGLEVIKYFSCSTQLSMKFIMLIIVKMPTIVGILTLISMINTTSESLKARNVFIFQHFSFYEHLKFHAWLCWAWKVVLYSLTLKAPRKNCIWKCRLLKSSAANNCLTLLTN